MEGLQRTHLLEEPLERHRHAVVLLLDLVLVLGQLLLFLRKHLLVHVELHLREPKFEALQLLVSQGPIRAQQHIN